MLQSSRPLRITAGIALLAASLAGCHGASPSSIPSVVSTNLPQTGRKASATAHMVIAIPPKSATNARSPHYISASTQSMTVSSVSNGVTAQIAEADLTPTSPNCASVTGGGTQCSITIIGASGANEFLIKLFDQTGGAGNLLSSGSVSTTLTAGQSNDVPLVLDGVPAKVGLVLGTSMMQVGTPNSTSVIVQAQDAQGNIIVGPGGFSTPITLSIANDPYNTLSLSTKTINSPGQVATLTYNGGSNLGSSITPSGSGIVGTPATIGATGLSANIVRYVNANVSLYPYDVSAFQNGTAAVLFSADGSTHFDAIELDKTFLGIVTPTAVQSLYMGDTTDPYNQPASGSVTSPDPSITVIHGMSRNLQVEPGTAYQTIATDSNKHLAYYSAAFTSDSAPNCPGATENSGVLGAFDVNAQQATEYVLKGVPMYLQVDSAGNVWFIETSGTCGATNLLPSGFAVGELSASGTVHETDFGVLNIAKAYPAAMSITPDGSAMFVADPNDSEILKIDTASLQVSATLQLTMTPAPSVIATSPDGTTVWLGNTGATAKAASPIALYGNATYGFVPGSKAFAQANLTEAVFPVAGFYAEGMTYVDGSFWFAGTDPRGGIGRLSGLDTGTPVSSYYMVSLAVGAPQELTAVSAADGYLWATDQAFGNIDVLRYGAPNNGTISLTAREPAGSPRRNPHPRPPHRPHVRGN